MMTMPLKRLAGMIDATLQGGGVTVTGMSHDTRDIEPGNLFCALPGERVHGHDFVAQARAAGAAAALVSCPVDVDLPQLVVDDVRLAMGRIASAWREQVQATVVGITGSNGKTTVKEMLAGILATQGPTLATRGNYNNEIGVPLTLARLGTEHRFAVIEMGASQAGDIAYLCEIARPEVGIVTNAAAAHLEGFGSLDGVASTKGEIFQSLPPSGLAVINADDAYSGLWQDMAGHCRFITFGEGDLAVVRGYMAEGRVHVVTPSGEFDFPPRLPGRHNMINALAATAAAVSLDVPLADIKHALSALNSLPGRLKAHQHPDGWVLIDDTYNANPGSLYAGLQVLAEQGREAWLVLGDMAELGSDARKMHAEMGQAALDMGVSRLYAFGPLAQSSASAFGRGARHFDSHEALSRALADDLHAGVSCLVKGSRSMQMEHIVRALVGEEA